MQFQTDDVIGALKRAVALNGAGHKQPRWMGYGPSGETPKTVEPGDHDSGSCRYASPVDATPSCIVGWAIFNLSRQAFHAIAEENGSASGTLLVLQEQGFEFSDNAKRLLIDAQSEADAGAPWGVAVERALTRLLK